MTFVETVPVLPKVPAVGGQAMVLLQVLQVQSSSLNFSSAPSSTYAQDVLCLHLPSKALDILLAAIAAVLRARSRARGLGNVVATEGNLLDTRFIARCRVG